MKKFIKLILIGVGILFIIFCIFVGVVIVDINKQEELLSNEVNKLIGLDLTKDNVNTDIVTSEEYAIIEKTIKDYLKDYSDSCKSFISAVDEFDFENMFTIDNFVNDGPDFVNSKGKLSKLRDTLNSSLNKLIEMSSEEYIVRLIKNKDIDSYYVDLYKQYMFGNDINSFNDTIINDVNDMKKISEEFNLFLDDCYNLYDFMSKNRNYWYVEGDIVYFATDELVNEYNGLLNKIILDSDDLIDYEDEDVNNGSVGNI